MTLLLDRPEIGETGFVWWREVLEELFARGNSYVYIRRNMAGLPIELIRADMVFMQEDLRTPNMWLYDLSFRNGRKIMNRVHWSDVLHFRGPAYDRHGGRSVSPITEVAAKSLGISLAAARHLGNTLARGAHNPLAIAAPTDMPAEHAEKFASNVNENYAGTTKAGKPLVLPPGYTADRIGFSSVDLQLLDLLKFQVVDIARIWQIPLYLLQHFESGSGVVATKSYEEQWQSFLRFSLSTNLEIVESELKSKLIDPVANWRNDEISFDTTRLIMSNLMDRAKIALILGQTGAFWTIDEVRELTGKPPATEEQMKQLRQPTGAPPQGDMTEPRNGEDD